MRVTHIRTLQPLAAPSIAARALAVGVAMARLWLSAAMTDWAGLRDAYGSAEHVPGLLEVAARETAWEAPAWQELWSRLCHQGSIYPASTAALPLLAAIARDRLDVAVEPALFLASTILASSGDTERRGVDLVAIAVRKLSLVRDRVDVLYALQCVAGVEGFTRWFEPLAGLAGGEVEIGCPTCGDHVYLELGEGGLRSTEFPDHANGTAVRPAFDEDLDPAATRLLSLARGHGHATVAAELLMLFGPVTCPVCRSAFRLADLDDAR